MRRAAAFAGGAATLWLAVGSPAAHLDHSLLTAHMVQHLLLTLMAAPLILLGMTPSFDRWRPHPAFCWLAGAGTVIMWHVPAVFEHSLRSPAWHSVEQVSFLISGILFWSPVITRPATWLVPLYLFLAILPCDALGAFLVFCDHLIYAQYRHVHGTLPLSPLQDQELAGAMMWVITTFAYMIPALSITTHLLAGIDISERRPTIIRAPS
jgi:cytochrome c oxidase assembly factor CtaG